MSQSNAGAPVPNQIVLPLSDQVGAASTTQGTFATTGPVAQICGQSWFSNSAAAADGDNITFKVSIPKGNYKAYLSTVDDDTSGKLDLLINGVVKVAGIDTYNVATSYGVVHNGAFSLSADVYEGNLTLLVNGKNALSSGYNFRVMFLELLRVS